MESNTNYYSGVPNYTLDGTYQCFSCKYCCSKEIKPFWKALCVKHPGLAEKISTNDYVILPECSKLNKYVTYTNKIPCEGYERTGE